MLSVRKNRGFTLIEVILVIILVGIIAGITGNLILFGAESYTVQYDRRDLMYQAKTALSRMDKEIRMLRSATATDILTFTATNLEFVDIKDNTIEYTLSGSNIVRTFNGTADTLNMNVSALTFSYLKKDGTAAVSASDIWLISVDLTVSDSETIRMRTRVFLRDVHGLYTNWKEV